MEKYLDIVEFKNSGTGTHTKKTYRSMEQNREPRNKPTHSVTKEARIYNGEKTASLIRVTGKPGQLHVKE